MMNLIANIALIGAALLDMAVLLGSDITAHGNNGHSNTKYNKWLLKNEELQSPKRLLILAVLIATFTTMAQQSWMVVMILAATLLIQAVVILRGRQWKFTSWNKRSKTMFATAMTLALIATGATAIAGVKTSPLFASRVSAISALLILLVTPLLTIFAAWILNPFKKAK